MSNDDGENKNRKSPESILNKYLPYILTAIVSLVATGLTLYVEHGVSERAEKASNTRLATELFSRREQAESDLRKDMFGTILRSFLDTSNNLALPENLSDKLLKLELLALNFGESLSLGPLFQEINRQILTPSSYKDDMENMSLDQNDYTARLERLARRVSDRQIAAFAGAGLDKNTFKITAPLDQVMNHKVYRWPDDSVDYQYPDFGASDREDLIKKESCLHLDGIVRVINVTLSKASKRLKTVKVVVEIDTTKPKANAEQECVEAMRNYCDGGLPPECDVTIEKGEPVGFTLDQFNFPMIDNALLSNNQRFATVISKFDTENENLVVLKSVLFPGEYASLRDKPQLNQAINHLRESMPGNEGNAN